MILDVRSRLTELREVLDRLDAQLASQAADRLPGLLVAKTVVAVDQAAEKLTKLAARLTAATAQVQAEAAQPGLFDRQQQPEANGDSQATDKKRRRR